MNKKIGIMDIIIILLFILAVYFILTRIFGHSATDITISITLFTLIGGLLYKLNREFGEFRIKTIHAFKELKKDINEIKNRLYKKR